MVCTPLIPAMVGRVKRIPVILRQAWPIEQVTGQPRLHKEYLRKQTNKWIKHNTFLHRKEKNWKSHENIVGTEFSCTP